jgi:hypothetical protein
MLRGKNTEARNCRKLGTETGLIFGYLANSARAVTKRPSMSFRRFLSQSLACRPSCGLACAWRYYAQWARTLKQLHDPFVARQPWISLPAQDVLGKLLSCGQMVFEYGGGGSTLYFLDRGLKVTTAEHNPEWFDRLRDAALASGKQSSWTGILREPSGPDSAVGNFDPADPDVYASSGPKYRGCCFRDYVRAIDTFPDGYFDLIVVDGRSRPACIKHAVAKVKSGGHLILDNTERSHYLTDALYDLLGGFSTVFDCYGPVNGLLNFSRTTIWVKSDR